MKRKLLMMSLGLGVLLAPGIAANVHAAPAAPVQTRPTSDEIEASRLAVGEADFDRLIQDRDYASQILQHVDRLDRAGPTNAAARRGLETLRLLALTTLERNNEVHALVDRILARRPREPGAYAAPYYAALRTEDWSRTVVVVETASQNVPGVGWVELRGLFERDAMGPLLQKLRINNEDDLRVRLAAGLFRIGWPGDGDVQFADFLRSILLNDRLDRGDRTAAIDFASGISTPAHILPMIVQPRYDAILAPGRDRLELLRQALAERDRMTAEAVSASPQNPKRVLERAQFLGDLGRPSDALALLQPFSSDVAATVAASDDGMWLINEAAYSLVALGRNDEAVALMARMAELSMEERPRLIGTRINYSEILWSTGRHAQALDYASQLNGAADGFANDYGKMWIASSIVCALAGLDREAEAAPQFERLRAHEDANPSALTRAYLCVGDTDQAAALMVRRLEGDDPERAIMALQDYSLASGDTQTGDVVARLTALRDRPDVRAALDRVGRVYDLPLARGSWGNF